MQRDAVELAERITRLGSRFACPMEWRSREHRITFSTNNYHSPTTSSRRRHRHVQGEVKGKAQYAPRANTRTCPRNCSSRPSFQGAGRDDLPDYQPICTLKDAKLIHSALARWNIRARPARPACSFPGRGNRPHRPARQLGIGQCAARCAIGAPSATAQTCAGVNVSACSSPTRISSRTWALAQAAEMRPASSRSR